MFIKNHHLRISWRIDVSIALMDSKKAYEKVDRNDMWMVLQQIYERRKLKINMRRWKLMDCTPKGHGTCRITVNGEELEEVKLSMYLR